MIQKVKWSFALSVLLSVHTVFASTPVEIKDGGATYDGTLFLPAKHDAALPLVVVVHEWWGKTEHPLNEAKRIAEELGYAALAVDLFGNGKTVDNPKDAGALAGPFYQNPAVAVERLKLFIAAAPDAAKKEGATLDSMKIAAIGYCFGGTQVLNLARAGSLPETEKLLGVVSFHGGLASSLKIKGRLQPQVLVLHGADDKMVSHAEVKAFKMEMRAAHAKYTFHAYPGATHAFTNPKATEIGKKFQIPIAYNEAADQDSWEKLKSFLKKIY